MGSKIANRQKYGYLFILPFMIFLTIFVIYPIIYSFQLSFFKWDGTLNPREYVGFANYNKLLFDDLLFWKSIGNTIIIWVSSFIPQLGIALFLAVVLNDVKLKGANFFRFVYFLPNLISMASMGALALLLLNWQGGQLNLLLMDLGIISEPRQWLMNVFDTRFAIAFILWLLWFGYTMLILMAGIKSISIDLFEAATVDGANKVQMVRYITIPCLKRIMTYTIVTSIIGGLTMYDIPFVLTSGNGSPQSSTLTVVMYLRNTVFAGSYNYGKGAAIGSLLFILVGIFVAIAFKLLLRNSKAEEV